MGHKGLVASGQRGPEPNYNQSIIQSVNQCNLAGTNYELPEDDTIVSKHVGAV